MSVNYRLLSHCNLSKSGPEEKVQRTIRIQTVVTFFQYLESTVKSVKRYSSLIDRVNPLSVNSDQRQFSPKNIHTLLRNRVMRINAMITKEKSHDLLSNSLN